MNLVTPQLSLHDQESGAEPAQPADSGAPIFTPESPAITSIHTPTITVKAGDLVENIHFAVTNRIGGVQAFEANTSSPPQR